MRKLFAVSRMAINDAIIYRNDMFMWSLSLLMGPVIYLLIWLAVVASGGEPPLNETEFVQYFLLAGLVRAWANGWNATFIAKTIRNGEISSFLLKPLSYLTYRFGDSIGGKVVKGIFTVTAIAILFILFRVSLPEAELSLWLLFIFSTFLAGIMVTLMDLDVGLLAFWFDDITGIDEFIDTLYMVASGVWVPIIVYPEVIQQLFVYLPFKYMVSFPVEIVLKQVQGPALVTGLVIQIAWLLIFIILYKILWSRGQVRYQAFGA